MWRRQTYVPSLVLAAWTLAACAGLAQESPEEPSADHRVQESLPLREQPLPLRALVRVPAQPMEPTQRFAWLVPTGPLGNVLTHEVETLARRSLHSVVRELGWEPASLATLEKRELHDLGQGPIIVRFRQRVDGLEVFGSELSVALTREHQPALLVGNLSPVETRVPDVARNERAALARAYEALAGEALRAERVQADPTHPGRYVLRGANSVERGTARLKPVWFQRSDRLFPAVYVELKAPWSSHALWAFVTSASGAELWYRHSLTAEETFQYRVWAQSSDQVPTDGPQGDVGVPHPTGLPDGFQAPITAPVLVSLDHGPLSTGAPWLPAGALTTLGNNVDAYADRAAPDGFGAGDLRAVITAPGVFDRSLNFSEEPDATDEQVQAAVTQLFYTTNYLHDWFYDAGFNEAAGNAQEDNFGLGGEAGDRVHAEAQDFSGRNNANMSTPSDGASPQMQMFLWDPNGQSVFRVTAPASLAGTYGSNVAEFGPQMFSLMGELVAASDGTGTSTDACESITNNVTGKLAFVDRGGCTYAQKARNAQAAGALAMVLGDSMGGPAPLLTGSDPLVTIPVLSVSRNSAGTLRAALATESVQVSMLRTHEVSRDSATDTMVVSHEWTHMLSNRLVGNGNGLVNNQGASMGEGWSDFVSLLFSSRESDAGSAPFFNGTFGTAVWVTSGGSNNGYYFGIRRYPYSVDLTKNPLTFQHITQGNPLPNGVPVGFGAGGGLNAEVHASGEVWANALWECYVALLRDTPRLSFSEARQRMQRGLVAGLKLTPTSPTFTEARDALLAALYLRDPTDGLRCAEGFARRGLGTGAVAPPRDSSDHVGVVESFTLGNDLRIVGIELDDSTRSCDNDALLDEGEEGRLRVTVENVGVAAIEQATGLVSSALATLEFPQGTSLTFPRILPWERNTQSLPVRLRGQVGVARPELRVTVTEASLVGMPTRSASIVPVLHADIVTEHSMADDVEQEPFLWGPASLPEMLGSLGWQRVEHNPGNHGWFAPDNEFLSEVTLVSPFLNVSTDEDFVLEFEHRYQFEASGTPLDCFDGGVLEVSNNLGLDWFAVPSTQGPQYSGTIFTGSGNFLSGREAWCDSNPGYPGFQSERVNFGRAYAGSTVLVRFRLGTDQAVGAAGWTLDNFRFSGLSNTPFAETLENRTTCGNRVPEVSAGPDQEVSARVDVVLRGSATDPEQDAIQYAWSQTQGPPVALRNAQQAVTSFTAPSVSEATLLEFALRASDASGAAEDRVQVRVVPGGLVDVVVPDGTGSVRDASAGVDVSADEALPATSLRVGGGCACHVETHPTKPRALWLLALAMGALWALRRRVRTGEEWPSGRGSA